MLNGWEEIPTFYLSKEEGMLATHNDRQRQKLDPYLVQKVMSASPQQLISYIYDAAIIACGQRDSLKAGKSVRELMKSLNFDYKEIAFTFYNVYRYVNYLIIKGNYEDARDILVDLKNTWTSAMNVS